MLNQNQRYRTEFLKKPNLKFFHTPAISQQASLRKENPTKL